MSCLQTCASNPCFPDVICYDDPRTGFKCGPCPTGFRGNGKDCKPTTTCSDNPCFDGVACVNANKPPGYRCGPCPKGYYGDGIDCKAMTTCSSNPCFQNVACANLDSLPGYSCGPCPAGYTGNGRHCDDIDECAYANPCDNRTRCINTSPGFQCSRCPAGFTSPHIYGIGVEHAMSLKQVCVDINECDDGNNGGCAKSLQCINTVGSFKCEKCLVEYHGNKSIGCHSHPTECPDGSLCNPNAFCIKRKGFVNYLCQCKIGWAGDGKVCGIDSDLDGFCDFDLVCKDRRCRAVCLIYLKYFKLNDILRITAQMFQTVDKKIPTWMALGMLATMMLITMVFSTNM